MEYLREYLSATQPLLKAPGSKWTSEQVWTASCMEYFASQQHTDKGAELDHGGHQALPETSAARRRRYLRKALLELVHDKHDGDDTLVVTEEEASDADEEGADNDIFRLEQTDEAFSLVSTAIGMCTARYLYTW